MFYQRVQLLMVISSANNSGNTDAALFMVFDVVFCLVVHLLAIFLSCGL